MTGTTTDRRQGITTAAAIKVACTAATTANVTLSGEQTIDGVACVTDDRVLVKNQTSGVDNGIYVVNTSSWERAKDWDGSLDVRRGTLVFVFSGTTNQGYWYVSTSNPIVPGTTSVTIAQASSTLAVVSAFAQTLLDDTTALIARQTLLLDAHGADVASAATVVLDGSTGDLIDITGTVTVTAVTLSEGQERTVRFTGSLLLTHSASLICPESTSIQTAAGDYCIFRGYAAGVVRVVDYYRLNNHGSDIVSAATINLDTATGQIVDVTGNTGPVTAITLANGRSRIVRFTGTPTLTNGASLVLPGSANITAAAGDYAIFVGYAAGVVRCVSYVPIGSPPLLLASTAQTQTGTSAVTAVTPAGLKGALLFSKGFESSLTAMTANTEVAIAHSLGAVPKLWIAVMRCKTADINYSVGDEVVLAAQDNGTDALTAYANATNIAVVFDATLSINNRGTPGTRASITYASWELRVRAWV